MSTYYPYFRGKQYELILLRDFAQFIAQNNICPIIEPVRRNTDPLLRALESLRDNDADSVLVVNPQVGDWKDKVLDEQLTNGVIGDVVGACPGISLGIVASASTSLVELNSILARNEESKFSVIHYGFGDSKRLAAALLEHDNIKEHIFIENHCSTLYVKRFRGPGHTPRQVLIRDGFQMRKNAEYPLEERFSDLHVTFEEAGVAGFGDFLVIGDVFRDKGGPAYAVAIHVTFLDPEQDEEMFIYHFKSDQNASLTNPAGKFAEALQKLIENLAEPGSHIFQSRAIGEFQRLYQEGHFPGLGKVKQISMQHHLELMADYLSRG